LHHIAKAFQAQKSKYVCKKYTFYVVVIIQETLHTNILYHTNQFHWLKMPTICENLINICAIHNNRMVIFKQLKFK